MRCVPWITQLDDTGSWMLHTPGTEVEEVYELQRQSCYCLVRYKTADSGSTRSHDRSASCVQHPQLSLCFRAFLYWFHVRRYCYSPRRCNQSRNSEESKEAFKHSSTSPRAHRVHTFKGSESWKQKLRGPKRRKISYGNNENRLRRIDWTELLCGRIQWPDVALAMQVTVLMANDRIRTGK